MLSGHIIGALIVAWLFLFYNVPTFLWLITATIITFTFYWFEFYSLITSTFFYLSFMAVYTVLCIKAVRKNLITRGLIDYFKQKLPKISKTESQAIDAGDVWWEGDIFASNINYSKYSKFKLSKLTHAERNFLNNEVEELCGLLDDWQIISQDKDLSESAWQFIKKNKFFAIAIPKEYGGLGFSAAAQACIVTKIASRSITAAVTIMVPNALGPAELLIHYGTKEQKNKYLNKLANCEDIPCFALTSLYAGSDAGGMVDQGVICEQEFEGKKVLGIKLNFNKRYITLAPVATVMGLAFNLSDPNNLYSDQKNLGITLALIPTDHPGIEIGNRHLAMYTPFQNGPIVGVDVFIPLNYVIGGNDYIGKGWFMLMECLSGGRGISLPALSAATTQSSFLAAVTYSNIRRQFKTPIFDLEGIQEQIAAISGFNFITNAINQVTTSAIDSGLKPAVVSGISKLHTTEFARETINKAMDIQAGKGIMCGPNNALANIYCGSPIAITVEGANILTRNLIIFGQGAFRAHPYVLQELRALNEETKSVALSKFDKVLFKHIKFVLSNIVRTVTYNLQRVYHRVKYKKDWLNGYKKDITRMSCTLALATDIALLFVGGKLKFLERMSARLGDIVSNIYLALCVIKVYDESYKINKENKKYIQQLDLHTKWALQYLLHRAEVSLSDFIRNFPNKYVAVMMKLLFMPFGASYTKPDDNIERALVKGLVEPTGFYENMTELCYKKDSPLGQLHEVFLNKHNLNVMHDKIATLVKNKEISYSNNIRITYQEALDKELITNEEFDCLTVFSDQVDQILNVDDFENLLFGNKSKQSDDNLNHMYEDVG